jgi:geranyl-CoA carboxylase alpha subunit
MPVPILLACGDDQPVRLNATVDAHNAMNVTAGETTHHVALEAAGTGPVRRVAVDGVRREVLAMVASPATVHLAIDGDAYKFQDRLRAPRVASDGRTGNELRAPMNGRVVRVHGKAGDQVVKGQCVVVLEAMKMQHEITAARDGVLADVPVKEGQQVATRALLAALT